MGARGGLIAPDTKTFAYLKGKTHTPTHEHWEKALSVWSNLFSDQDANFDQEYEFEASDISPMITYGTNPGMGIKIQENIPLETTSKALDYMGFNVGQNLVGQQIDYVFIGSCTNSRIEDLRLVADFVKGKKKASDVNVWIVPGSKKIEAQAIAEGLDQVFKNAGFDLRQPGCSACLGMNDDKVPAGKYCVSTSNRNFEGRQGPGARTFLVSPLMAAAAAVTGEISDVRNLL